VVLLSSVSPGKISLQRPLDPVDRLLDQLHQLCLVGIRAGKRWSADAKPEQKAHRAGAEKEDFLPQISADGRRLDAVSLVMTSNCDQKET